MTAPAINFAFPTQPQAAGQGGSSATAGAAGAFEALLGALFGGQTGIAAELFAGAAPGAKGETADGGTSPDGEPDAQAETLAGAMAMPPTPPLLVSVPREPLDRTGVVAGDDRPTPVSLLLQPADPDAALVDGDVPPPIAVTPGRTEPLPPIVSLPPQRVITEPTPEPLVVSLPPERVDVDVAPISPEPLQPPVPPIAPPPARTRAPRDVVTAGTHPTATPVASSAVAQPVEPLAETQARAAVGVDAVEAAPLAAQDEATDLPAPELDAPTPAHAMAKADAAATDTPVAPATTQVRGAPETVAHLAANIIKKLEGRSTRFDVELEPLGLGKVDVRIEIGAQGRLTAALSFDNPQAQAELRGRANELTRALEQAGFDLSGGLSFDVADQRGQQGQAQGDQNQAGAAWRGRAFQAALDQAGDAVEAAVNGALNLQRRWNAGVDIRI